MLGQIHDVAAVVIPPFGIWTWRISIVMDSLMLEAGCFARAALTIESQAPSRCAGGRGGDNGLEDSGRGGAPELGSSVWAQ